MITKISERISIAVVLVITAIAFFPILSNSLVNWDDQEYITNNSLIRDLSFKGFREIFITPVMYNYHPLTILSYCFDYFIGGLNPAIYHTGNLILHLLNTYLVLILVRRLANNLDIAIVASLFFGIHPMHVESVAWASERKDVLYTFFFLASLLCYLKFQDQKQRKYLYYTLVLFVLSLLSKGQAVVLTPVLFLIDYLQSRKINKANFIEKIPFILLSLVFGIIAIKVQSDSVNAVKIEGWQSFLYGWYGLLIYLIKAIVPLSLSAFYPYNFSPKGLEKILIYVAIPLLITIAGILYKRWGKDRIVIFGFLFFLITILPVLQFLPVGRAVVSERYSYVPYIGLFLALSSILKEFMRTSAIREYAGLFLICVGFTSFTYASRQRCKVWKDSNTLWTNVLTQFPDCELALNNRASDKQKANDFKAVVSDLSQQIIVDSLNPEKIAVRASMEQYKLKDYISAIRDYKKAISLKKDYVLPYQNLGLIYIENLQQYKEGIEISKEGLKIDSTDMGCKNNLAAGYFRTAEYKKAIDIYNSLIKGYPDQGMFYYVRSLCYGNMHDIEKSYNDGMKAKSLGYTFDDKYLKDFEKQRPELTINKKAK